MRKVIKRRNRLITGFEPVSALTAECSESTCLTIKLNESRLVLVITVNARRSSYPMI